MLKGITNYMKKLLLFILIVSASTAMAQSKNELQLWKRVEALNDAIFLNKDSAALVDLVRDDVTYGHSGGSIENKEEMIAKAIHNQSVYENRKTERGFINIVKNTAVVRHIFSADEIKANGDKSPLKLSVMQVWIKKGGVWRLAGRQSVKAK